MDPSYLGLLNDGDDAEEWLGCMSVNYSIALREAREKGDPAEHERLLEGLRRVVDKSIEIKVYDDMVFSLLARHTTEPRERLRLYSLAYELRITDRAEEYGFDEQAKARVEAGELLRSIGLAHEALGDRQKAADCFNRALAHLQEGADLFETHCLSENPDNDEGETFPLRPRLLKELKRVTQGHSETREADPER